MPRITLIGKPGCHLCDVAKAALSPLARDLGEQIEELSINDDIELEMRYWEHIPVVLVDGREVCHWQVDEGAVRAALS